MQYPEYPDETPATPIAAILRYDASSHISWLEMESKPDESTRAALKMNGWRWSGYRKQWYNGRQSPSLPQTSLISIQEGGYCDYSSERAERLQRRADAHSAKADAAYQRAHAAVAMIPLGQPILVGHHSERGHRRAIARSHAAMDTSVAEMKTAERLRHDAASSARHQAYQQTPEAMQRRLDRLSADHRAMQRNDMRRARELATLGDEPSESDRAYTRRMEAIRAEIADLQQRIANAGGIAADRLGVEVGDLVRACGFPAIVRRVNRKTFTVEFSERTGWKMTVDRTKVTAILRKHDTPDEASDEA
jgi:hypothetical protein